MICRMLSSFSDPLIFFINGILSLLTNEYAGQHPGNDPIRNK